MLRRIRQMLREQQCKRSEHIPGCEITVFPLVGFEAHDHWCLRCGLLLLHEMRPIQTLGKRLLTDMGIAADDQRETYVN